MNTLVIDTSDKTARLGLFQEGRLADSLEWEAHLELSKTFYQKLDELLVRNKVRYKDPGSIIVVRGPGSFTGLRIGIVIVNAFSYALGIETVGVIQEKKMSLEAIYSAGEKGLKKGQIIEPFYGREPNITQKKRQF